MSKSKKPVTTGYYYSMSLDIALCHSGVDEVRKIKFADRLAWEGSVASGSIAINSPNLFGGENREGGVSGAVEILNGAANQPINQFLQTMLSPTGSALLSLGWKNFGPIADLPAIPAFRGVCRLLFKTFYIGLNPYLKNLAIQARRTDTRADMSAMWYLPAARIGDDMNPAHVIYELYTDKHWGLGLDTAHIDEGSFTAAADKLVAEQHGISFLWDGTKSVSDVVDFVLGQINGVVRQNITTGKIELKLIRDDYILDGVFPVNENHVIKIDSFQRSGWEDTVNQVTVIYHDEATDQDRPITVQDLGNVSIQNRVVPKTLTFPGVSHAGLAKVLAMREIKIAATPLSSVTLTCKRSVYGLNKGDVFKFSWQKYGIVGTAYRVCDIDYGDLTNSQIIITAIEDVFAFENSVYTNPVSSEWSNETQAPANLSLVKLVEATYWDAIFNISAADRAQLLPDYGIVGALAARSSALYLGYGVHSRVAPADFALNGNGNFAATGVIATTLGQENSSTFEVTSAIDMDHVAVGKYAYINNEIVAVTAIDSTAGTISINRGVLDTVPTVHPANSRIWFADGRVGFDGTDWIDTDIVDVKLTPTTGLGSLPVADASSHSITLANRAARPYPPGNVKINGQYYPSVVIGDITLTWSHRDRTLQTVSLNPQTDGDIGPEPGTSYIVRLYAGEMLVSELVGISGTSHLFTATSNATKIELTAIRNGLTAWQTHTLFFVCNPNYKLDFSQISNSFYIPIINQGV